MMTYGKIVDDKLILTDDTKFEDQNGTYVRVNKTEEELEGYLPVKYSLVQEPSIYQIVEETYHISNDELLVVYTLKDKEIDEIITINEAFWKENYFQILSLLPDELYAPYTSYLDGTSHDLLKDDYAVLLLGASANQLTYLDVYSKPNMTNKITSEYMEELKVTITNPVQMANILGFFGAMAYRKRTVPTVV